MRVCRTPSRMLVAICVVASALVAAWSAPALAQREHVFSSSFGSATSTPANPEPLSSPAGLAVNDETGDVYVIDRGNRRVEIFSSTGSYIGQFDGSGSPTGAFSPPERGGIAIDDSTNLLDPSKGDVYVLDMAHNVIDKFSPAGVYIGQITGTSSSSPFPTSVGSGETELAGIAVDPGGDLWVELSLDEGHMDQFDDALANEYVSTVHLKIRDEGTAFNGSLGGIGFALDSEGDFYTGLRPVLSEKLIVPTKFSKVGEVLAEKLDEEETTGVAVDASSNDVYVDHETGVAAYSPSTSLIERFGSPQMQSSEGIAVDSTTGAVYASSAGVGEVDVFTAFVVPDVTTGSASHFSEASVTVSGTVNPDGLPVTACAIEYGTEASAAYGQSVPCSPSPGAGTEPVAVSAELTGLEGLTKYRFRLNVSNANGSAQGQVHTFVTPEPVTLSQESVTDVSSTSALFSAQVDPGGAETTYSFEYGTSVSYGESVPVPAGYLGAGVSDEPVSVLAQDLLGEATYHVRLVASNVLGSVYGPDQTFTTQAGGGEFALPDDRAWEMVSPSNKEGALIPPIFGGSAGDGLIEASVNGGAISYMASGPVGTNVIGDAAPYKPTQVLSRRGSSGWSSEDIATPRKKPGAVFFGVEYFFFSSDLSHALLERPRSEPLTPGVTESTPYLRDNEAGSYVPLVTASNVTPPGTSYGPLEEPGEDPKLIAATPDLSHVLFYSPMALTSNAIALHGEEKNIYEWSAGELQLVNVLPKGAVSEGARLGGYNKTDTRDLLSGDGSRVFFEAIGNAEATRSLYMRDTATGQTVEVDAPAPGASPLVDRRGEFQTASADGSDVFFLDEQPLTPDSKLTPQKPGEIDGIFDLYVCQIVEVAGELKCNPTDLSVDQNAGEAADVQKQVVGASEDGSIVYFVATGQLASGAEAGKDNLYVVSRAGSTWSAPRLVAVLSEEDGDDWDNNPRIPYGSSAPLPLMTSRVSPNGNYLTFMSEQSLTGYDNRDASSGQPDEEVFLYDEAAGRLRCVSCNPSGARPQGLYDYKEENEDIAAPLVDAFGEWSGRWLAANIPGWTPSDFGSSGGDTASSRVFYRTKDACSSTAPTRWCPRTPTGKRTSMSTSREGVGSCTRPGGCVSLISSGTSSEESAFLDASENGDDVFFLTTARLVSGRRYVVRRIRRSCVLVRRAVLQQACLATALVRAEIRARPRPRRSRRSSVRPRVRRSPAPATSCRHPQSRL